MSKECGIRKVMDILGGKWKLNILWVISQNEDIRFNELRRQVRGITNVMLTRSLDSLAENRLIKRQDYKTIPPHVEYSLTQKGKSLVPFLKDLDNWGRENF